MGVVSGGGELEGVSLHLEGRLKVQLCRQGRVAEVEPGRHQACSHDLPENRQGDVLMSSRRDGQKRKLGPDLE